MKIYGDPVLNFCSQKYIDESNIELIKTLDLDIKDNWIRESCSITQTIFDYMPDAKFPPCVNFLGNPLTDKVYVLSFDLSNSLPFLPKNSIDLALTNKIKKNNGLPLTPLQQIELAWIGVETSNDFTIINNNQISGYFFKYLNKKQITQIHKLLLKLVELEYKNIYVPHHSMLKKYVDRTSNHPNRAIKIYPYSSSIMKGYIKVIDPFTTLANKFLEKNECIWWENKWI